MLHHLPRFFAHSLLSPHHGDHQESSLSALQAEIARLGEEGLELGSAHVLWMALVVEEDEAFNPMEVGLFSAVGVVLAAQGLADAVEEFGWVPGSRGLLRRRSGS